MTRRYYIKLAALIAREVDEFPYDPRNILSLLMLARKLCTLLNKENPRFDRKRFLQACGLHDFKMTKLKQQIKDDNELLH